MKTMSMYFIFVKTSKPSCWKQFPRKKFYVMICRKKWSKWNAGVHYSGPDTGHSIVQCLQSVWFRRKLYRKSKSCSCNASQAEKSAFVLIIKFQWQKNPFHLFTETFQHIHYHFGCCLAPIFLCAGKLTSQQSSINYHLILSSLLKWSFPCTRIAQRPP